MHKKVTGYHCLKYGSHCASSEESITVLLLVYSMYHYCVCGPVYYCAIVLYRLLLLYCLMFTATISFNISGASALEKL